MLAPALLFIDTETSGLVDKTRPLSDPGQPWVVSIGAELTDIAGQTVAHFATQIRADGRKIKPGAEKAHGISNLDASRGGVNETAALGVLVGFLNQIPYGGAVIGYGLPFDRDAILGVLLRRGAEKSVQAWTRSGLRWIDLMEPCAPFCRIPSEKVEDTYRWPSLDEAGDVLCGMPRREGFHSSFDDASRARRVFFELVRRGAIEVPVIKARDAA